MGYSFLMGSIFDTNFVYFAVFLEKRINGVRLNGIQLFLTLYFRPTCVNTVSKEVAITGLDNRSDFEITQTDQSDIFVSLSPTELTTLDCPICFTNMRERQIVFNPCGHSCCKNCAPRIDSCYQCRADIISKIRVFE